MTDARQVPNSAGGYVFTVDWKQRLTRFLVLGTWGGTYYATERDHTAQSTDAVREIIGAHGEQAVQVIVDVSLAGRAPKQQPTMFALALAASASDVATRRAALAALPVVCRTGTHLFLFTRYVEQFRGWGRTLRTAIGEWYTGKDVDALAYQAVKYQGRSV
jgi:60 kDa SS-A/Ro ribonucleoprotein